MALGPCRIHRDHLPFLEMSTAVKLANEPMTSSRKAVRFKLQLPEPKKQNSPQSEVQGSGNGAVGMIMISQG